MSKFFRLLKEQDKCSALAKVSSLVRNGEADSRMYQVAPEDFDAVPGSPFAYWVSDKVRGAFNRFPPLEGEGRAARQGLATADDFRFVRGWWEVEWEASVLEWVPFAKGGSYSPFYADVYLVVKWSKSGAEIRNFCDPSTGAVRSRPQNTNYFFQQGLTWGDRTSDVLSVRPWPEGGVFSVKGSAGFFPEQSIYFALGLMNSKAFNYFLEMLVNAGSTARSYQVGVIGAVPYPPVDADSRKRMGEYSRRSWSLKRTLDTTTETSHAFLLPALLRGRVGEFNPPAIEAELASIQSEIDEIAFDLYDFTEADRLAAMEAVGGGNQPSGDEPDEEEEASESEAPPVDGLLSWAVGVAFGHFDYRLATGERAAPAEPEPFDPLPARSPGMLPAGAEPFHTHAGILVDDPGHPHDLARLVEEVLARVDVAVPDEVRWWLGREFFEFHLRRYSKSRRKAPIYWPLATASGSYTLWVYYPNLSDQTLYSLVNDFLEPKLQQVVAEARALREKGAGRSRDDEKRFEELQAFELELIELRDALLKLAPSYKPRHDDGVQVSAAPLWSLFRFRPWQKVLKETWSKLEKGDYDWAHLAMSYWPERVREKCRTDKSLAIAHGLEDLYEEPEPASSRGTKRKGGPSK